MTLKEQYDHYLDERRLVHEDSLSWIWENQESRYVHPFQLCGNVWYVGDSWVGVHLIDTGDGLLLLDGGNCGATAMLIQAIWEAGFNPADVKWMVMSHGHLDHFGAANFFRRMFGTKLYLGEPDARMFRERPELSYIQDSHNAMDELFEPDVEIQDGDLLTFGNLNIQFYLVPGHSDGCIAAFFDITDSDKTYRAGYYGGFGFNTLQSDYLEEIGDPSYSMRNQYLASLAKVRNQKVDVFLGNHPINNQTLERRKKQIENPTINPFIDSSAWGSYLDEMRDALLAFMADPNNQPPDFGKKG